MRELQERVDSLEAQLATARKLHASAADLAMWHASRRWQFIEQPWYKRMWHALTLKGL